MGVDRMTDLQDALKRWDEHTRRLRASNINSARLVANPNYQAAIDVMWDRDGYSESKEENMKRAVDAALTPPGDT